MSVRSTATAKLCHLSRQVATLPLALWIGILGTTACDRSPEVPTAAKEAPAPDDALAAQAVSLSDAQLEDLVRRSYQYVAMYNVNNKFALKQGGWNACRADTELKDHTLQEIARPNNDTLYIACMLDLRKDPVILKMPAFESDHIATEQPDGVPEENWLPINRKDEDLSVILRIYAPDPDRMKTWQAPRAELVN